MEKITLLNTAIGSTNKGDDIIMSCAEEELDYLKKKYFTIHVPTHLSSFRTMECIGSLPDSAGEVYQSKYKFVCGTNLLSSSMFHRTNQWNIHYFNCKPVQGSVLLGVGSVGSGKPDWYTRRLYRKVLSRELIHSVREERACGWMKSMGFKCFNTGCVTMWKLTPEFCEKIPTQKADRVVFTLTDYKKDSQYDRNLIQILRKNYQELNCWLQGIHDLEYLQSLGNISDINIVRPELKAYDTILMGNIDYVGTRLHAGIYAMRKGKRSIILRVDERMNSMAGSMPNNSVVRSDLRKIEEKIKGDVQTKVCLEWDAISEWKGQFY